MTLSLRRPRPARVAVLALAALVASALLAAPSAGAAASADGPVLTWGFNDEAGTLGTGGTAPSMLPLDVALPAGTRVASAEYGRAHGVALSDAGDVYTWGFNGDGELGDGTTTDRPTPIKVWLPSGLRAIDVAAGGNFTLALTPAGAIYAWGWNYYGQLGNGSRTDSRSPLLVKLPTGVRATSISAGDGFAFAMTSDGSVYGWGLNESAQLGLANLTNSAVPVKVLVPAGVKFVSMDSGGSHTLAVTADGQVYGWGSNAARQLSLGGYTRLSRPTLIPMPGNAAVVAVAAGDEHSIAVTATGGVITWGDNEYGELGAGDTVGHTAPVQVALPAGAPVRSVAAGSGFSLAVRTDGSVLGWGVNWEGELGNNTVLSSDTPVDTSLPAGVQAMTVGAGTLNGMAVTPLFRDVPPDNPFADDINWLARFRVTGGTGPGTFAPAASMSRQAMAAYLYRFALAGGGIGACRGASAFKDVPADSEFCAAITWLSQRHVVQGYPDGTFRPTAPVSRQAMAAYLYRYAHDGADAGACTAASPFKDVPAASAFCGDIAWLAAAKPVTITTGYSDGTFRPEQPIARQGMAAFLHRYFLDFHGYGPA